MLSRGCWFNARTKLSSGVLIILSLPPVAPEGVSGSVTGWGWHWGC